MGELRRSSRAVLACTVGNGVGMTPMVYTVFGLFLLPIAGEFHWPRSTVSIVLLIVAIASAIGYPIVGRTIDRYGSRVVILWGLVAFALAVASVSLVGGNRLELYAAYALIGVTGTIPSSVTFTKVIAGWFDRHRGLALGIVGGIGNGIGSAISPLYAQALIERHGWRAGYVGLGAAILCLGLPLLFLLLRDPPARAATGVAGSGTDATLKQARAGGTFWLILSAIALGAGCMTAVFAHVVPILTDRGLDGQRATLVLVTFSIVTAGWQVAVGSLLDRIPRPWVTAPFYGAALAGLLLLAWSASYPQLLVAGALMGLGLGTEYGVLPYFLSRYYGLRHYGAISGAVYGVIVLIQGVTPFLMDLVFDQTGSYRAAIVAICFGLACGALLILRLPRFDLAVRH